MVLTKKKLDLFLKIYDYKIFNVKFLKWNDDSKILFSQIDEFSAHDLIVLNAYELSQDIEQLDTILDVAIAKKVRIIAVLDRLEISSNSFYLRAFEKKALISTALNSKKYKSGISKYTLTDSEHKKQRIGIYCRVSTREQTLGYSIENQKAKNMMYLELFDYDSESIEFYIDDGQSAANLERKNMKRMLADIREKKLDEIIIYKLDRLTRNVLNTYELIQMFLDYDVNLIAVLDNLDIRTANGRMIVGILAIFAQWERETIIERTTDGQLQMCAEGKYPKPGCPLGYTKDKEKYLSVNESTSKIIKDIFRWAKAGFTFVEIQHKIKAIYDMELRADRIRRIIFEDGYYGEFSYKEFVFSDTFPALISKEEAMDARKMAGKRAVMYGKEQNKFYYRNKVKCKCCGDITIGIPTYKNNKRYYYYYCKQCNMRINQDIIIKTTLFDMICKSDEAMKETIVQETVKNISNLEAKMKRVTRQYGEDLITDDAYSLIIKELELKLKQAKGQFGNVKIVNGNSWDSLSDDEKRNIIENTILTMTVDLEKKKVTEIEFEE